MTIDPNDATNVFVTYTDFDITGTNPGCNTLGDILASIQVVAFNTAGTPTATMQGQPRASGRQNRGLGERIVSRSPYSAPGRST